MKGNSRTWLPPRRFAPPLLFQEGSRNLKLDRYMKMQLLRYLQSPLGDQPLTHDRAYSQVLLQTHLIGADNNLTAEDLLQIGC